MVVNLSDRFNFGNDDKGKDSDDPLNGKGNEFKRKTIAIFCTAENPCGSALCDYC